jgi:hypothetical protein
MSNIVATPGSESPAAGRAGERGHTTLRERDRHTVWKIYAYCLQSATVVQVMIADATFLIYGFYNNWRVPGITIDAWLGATVVQLVATVLVIARSLFALDRPRAASEASTDCENGSADVPEHRTAP